MDETPLILFLCPHAAAKSVIAAAYYRREAQRLGLAVRVDAAGIDPDPEVSPSVVAALGLEGIDVSAHRPRRATHEDAARASRIVSIGCDLADLPPGAVPVERWDDVPSTLTDLDGAKRSIAGHVARMLAGAGTVS